MDEDLPLNKLVIITVVFGLGFAAAFAFQGPGVSQKQTNDISLKILLWGGIGFAVLGELARSIYLRRRSSFMKQASLLCVSGFAIVALQSFSIPLRMAVFSVEINQAKQYCEDLAPIVETYKAEHGLYPADLTVLNRDPKHVPILIRGVNFYDGYGETYRFYFIDPFGYGAWEFSSWSPKWQRGWA